MFAKLGTGEKILFFVCALLAFVAFPTRTWALGASPAKIVVDNVLVGSTLEKTITVSRADPRFDDVLIVTVTGTGQQYITLSTTSISLPKGEKQVPFTIKIQPKQAASGSYSAKVLLTAGASSIESPESSRVAVGLSIDIHFTVVETEIRSFKIAEARLRAAPETDGGLLLSITANNAGNIEEKLTSARVLVRLDSNEADDLPIIDTTIPLVASFAPLSNINTLDIPLAETLPSGIYRVQVQIHQGETVIFTSPQQDFSFNHFIGPSDQGQSLPWGLSRVPAWVWVVLLSGTVLAGWRVYTVNNISQ